MSTCRETLQLAKQVKDVRFSVAPLPDELAQELRAREKSGYDKGWLEAQKLEREQLAGERAELIELQNGVLRALGRALPQMARHGEKALIALALEAVDKLMAGLPVDPDLIEATVREALGQVEDGAAVSVLLHPEDLALLQHVNSKVLPGNPDDPRLQFRGSAEVTRGGCILQTRFGVIDACRETKSELLKKSLLD